MHEILLQKSEAIRHAIDGRARFTDVAELLKTVTGDVQLEVAKRLQLLPIPAPPIPLQPAPPKEPITFDIPAEFLIRPGVAAQPIPALEADVLSAEAALIEAPTAAPPVPEEPLVRRSTIEELLALRLAATAPKRRSAPPTTQRSLFE